MKWVGEGLGFVGGVDVFGWLEHKGELRKWSKLNFFRRQPLVPMAALAQRKSGAGWQAAYSALGGLVPSQPTVGDVAWPRLAWRALNATALKGTKDS
jgi:hypothetical protein